MIGTRLLHYEITDHIDGGHWSRVYLAQDLAAPRQVAIKVFAPTDDSDPESRRRFLQSATAQARIIHPNVAVFYEAGEQDGELFIVMEYVQGVALSRLAREGELSIEEVIEIAIQIADGLGAAHEHEVIHRDVKPDNIIVTSDRRVKVVDFGLARLQDGSSLSKSGTVLGSAYYMSPEQIISSRVDHRSDIFAFGVVLYELLCGRRPFQGTSEPALHYEIMNVPPHPVARYCSGVPDRLHHLVMKCLQKDRDERYQSMADVVADLRVALRDLKTGRISGYGLNIVRRGRRRRTALAGLAIVVLTGALLMLGPGLDLRNPGRAERSLAVLPFACLDSKPENEVLAEGLRETLTSKLIHLEPLGQNLFVIPASAVRKAEIQGVRDAQEAFDVRLAVTGTLQFLEDLVRITINLVDVPGGEPIDSRVVDGHSGDIFSLQDSAAFHVASMLAIEVNPEDREHLREHGTNNAKAGDAYMRGLGFLSHYRESVGMASSIDIYKLDSAVLMLREAVTQDRRYGEARVALAEALLEVSQVHRRADAAEEAIRISFGTLEIYEDYASAYTTLGRLHAHIGRTQEAIHELRRAVQLNPRDAMAYESLGDAYSAAGQREDAEATLRQFISQCPNRLEGYVDLAVLYSTSGRSDKARDVIADLLELGIRGYAEMNRVGAAFYFAGDQEQAEVWWKRSIATGPNFMAYSNLGILYCVQESWELADSLLQLALAKRDTDYRIWSNLATAYEHLPDRAEDVRPAYERTIELALQELSVNEANAEVTIHIAEAYASLDDTAHALEYCHRALALDTVASELPVRAALIEDQVGTRDRAVALLQRALKLGYPREVIDSLPQAADLIADPRLQ